MPTLTLVCTIHGPDLASDGALPDVSCAPVHGRRTALQTWASRKPRRLRLDGQGRDVERRSEKDLSGSSLAQLDQRGQREPHPSGCDCKLLNSLTDFNGIRVLSRLGRPTRSSRAPHRYDSDARAFTRALYRGATPMKVGNGEWGTGNVASYQCCQLSIWVKEKMQVKSGFYHRDSEARSPIGNW